MISFILWNIARFKKVAVYLVLFLVPFSAYSADSVLKMHIWEGYAPDNYIQKFQQMIKKKTGRSVKIEKTFVSDASEFFKLVRGKKVHIIAPSHNIIKDERYNFIKKKLLLPLNLAKIPNYKDINPILKNADYITENGKVYGVPLIHGPYGLVYNTKFVNGVNSWNDLWLPKYKNKYSIVYDYSEVNIYITALAMGKTGKATYDYNSLRKDSAFENKLVSLIKNTRTFWYGVDKAENLKGLSLATSWGFSLSDLKNQGEDWKFGNPREGSTGWVDNLCVAKFVEKDAFLKDVAYEWLNFAIAPDFQANVGIRMLSSDPSNVNIKHLLTKAEIKKHHLNNLDYFSEKRILWPTLSKRDRNGLDRLWKSALKKAGKEKK